MKKLFLLFFLITTFSCSYTYENMSVLQYMKQLENGTYESYELPLLDKNDIPTLIEYVQNKQIIAKHPTNPISSFHLDSVTLGVMAMWTIESIRLTEINNNKSTTYRYPSLNPRLVDTTYTITNKMELQYIASTSYANWWSKNYKSELSKLNDNPLQNTSIRWR